MSYGLTKLSVFLLSPKENTAKEWFQTLLASFL